MAKFPCDGDGNGDGDGDGDGDSSYLDVSKLASVKPPCENPICCPVERMEPGCCDTKCLEYRWHVNGELKIQYLIKN